MEAVSQCPSELRFNAQSRQTLKMELSTFWHCYLQAEPLSIDNLDMNLLYQSHLMTPKYCLPLRQETKESNCFPCCPVAAMLLHIFTIPK